MRKRTGIQIVKKGMFIAGAVLLLSGLQTKTAWADVEINETNFPDSYFREYVSSEIDDDEDNVLSDEEIENTTVIDLGVDITQSKSLEGIGFFTKLKKLYCRDNELVSLDLSENTELTELNCDENQLTSLDMSKNTALTKLNCNENQLTNLDIRKNTELTEFSCYKNRLTSLDVSQNIALKTLDCSSNCLTNLDVSNNAFLVTLECSDNQLSSLKRNNPLLENLTCSDNLLDRLDVSNDTSLKTLVCGNNKLEKLDVGQLTALAYLDCAGNPLGSIDVRKNKAVEYLICASNQLTSLDVSENVALTYLDCSSNQLRDLDITQNTALIKLYCSKNQINSLDVSKNIQITVLCCSDNQLNGLDVSKNIKLFQLECYDNQLSNLDVSNNPDLMVFSCRGNLFSSVDVTGLRLYSYDGDLEGNILRVEPQKVSEGGNDPADQKGNTSQTDITGNNSVGNNVVKVNDQVASETIKNEKGNESIPENSSFTITVVSSDGKTSGQAAFDGVEDENAAAVTIPKVIYISGVPYNVTTVSPKAFEKAAENAGYKVTDNRVDSLTVEYSGQVNAKKTKKTVNIPEYSNYRGIHFKVTSIAAKSFRKNTKVTKVKIASSITMIGANCFEGCSKLQQVVVGKGLTEIGKNAFKNCKKLTLIQLKGTKLKKVGKSALKGVNAKCKFKVPQKQVKVYTKLFKGKGQKKTVKIEKA